MVEQYGIPYIVTLNSDVIDVVVFQSGGGFDTEPYIISTRLSDATEGRRPIRLPFRLTIHSSTLTYRTSETSGSFDRRGSEVDAEPVDVLSDIANEVVLTRLADHEPVRTDRPE